MPDIKPKKAGAIAKTAAPIPLFLQPQPTDTNDQLLVYHPEAENNLHPSIQISDKTCPRGYQIYDQHR